MKNFRRSSRLLWPLVLATGCAVEGVPPVDESGDLDGIEEVNQGLTDLSSQCGFVSGTGVMTLALATGDVALVNKSSSGLVVINGFACGGATSTTLKKLVVTGSAGAETLILDYMGGTFAPGITGAVGVDVDLLGGTDAVKLRGSKAVDAFVFGASGITINADTLKDIAFANVETFVATMSDGNDTVSAAGSATTGATFTADVTVYGGAGDDTLRGGDGDDTFYGNDGNDTFTNGTASDGADTFNGGAGTDTVDYSGRSNAVTINLDTTANDGEALELDKVVNDVENGIGGGGGDTIVGSASDNVFDGDAGADTISGGVGNDTLKGGAGADTLNGDAGDDVFDESTATSGADAMHGGAGTDKVDYSGRTNDLTVVMDGATGSGETSEGDTIFTDVENITGGAGLDTLTGNAFDNQIEGGADDDVLSGLGGDDVIDGNAGTDDVDCGLGDADILLDSSTGTVAGCEL